MFNIPAWKIIFTNSLTNLLNKIIFNIRVSILYKNNLVERRKRTFRRKIPYLGSKY